MIIDPHVHLRDEEWAYKSTIAQGLETAKQQGVVAVFDMPNLPRPVTTEQRVLERLAIAKQANSPVFYATYIGATANPEQSRHAIDVHKKYFPKVIGIKLFAGYSVGDLAVVDEQDQRKFWQTISDFKGVVACHCEKESLLKPELWDPTNPVSHCLARPYEAELQSIKDQIRFAYDACFQGVIHIAHITTPEAAEFVNNIRKNNNSQFGRLKVTCGATSHHLFRYDELMNNPGGIMLKVNPPLRTRKQQQGLLECLLQGKIDWIETDHAPHSDEEKTGRILDGNGKPVYMSGISGLEKTHETIQKLKELGLSEERIQDLTFNNITKTFNLNPDFYNGTS